MDEFLKKASLKIRNNALGYSILEQEFFQIDTLKIKELIANSDHVKSYLGTPFQSINNLISNVPELEDLLMVFTGEIRDIIGTEFKCTKSIYYNKTKAANWELDFHQDLTINLKEQINDNRFNKWNRIKDYYQVEPPVSILENIITVRLHLDNMTSSNGTLRVIPKSHNKGILTLEDVKLNECLELVLKEGDILIMSPLLLHASARNLTNDNRGVIHLEFSSVALPWNECFF